MKVKTLVLGCLILIILVSFAYEKGMAGASPTPTSKIGVVSVRKIFQNCQRNVQYRQDALAEQEKIMAQLDALVKEIEAAEAGLKTLKPDSDDYMQRTKELMQKKAAYQADREFFTRQLEAKDHKWTEELYKHILAKTAQVAKQKNLDLVFENAAPELPITNPNDLMLAIRTHKVLYNGGCLDISDDVMALIDDIK